MRIRIICMALCLMCGHWARAQAVSVSPVPQEMQVKEGKLNFSSDIQIVGSEAASPYAVEWLKALCGKSTGNGGKIDIYIGEKGDKAVRKYAKAIPQQPEGYYLLVEEGTVVLAGADERGTFYAVQTLAQLLQDGQLPYVEIHDYPAVRFRGVVEGFYGTPWSHEARLRQLEFYGQNKMNTYIYGPKDDPYHRTPHWREPYPEQEARQIAELATKAKENAVDFVWAIHPGQDIKWNTLDRDLLLAKFEKMYRLGVRSFAVFFDDISGEGTDPSKQADLLNYVDEHFVKAKGDVTPLIMCPTIYNRAWERHLPDYLSVLGEELNPSIQIMWTGNSVVSDITVEGVEWVNARINRQAYIWWNFPVTDYVRDHLLLGRIYGLETAAGTRIAGFTTNPMEHPEASKIAIYSIADYAWNPQQFNSVASWKRAVCTLLPGDADALQVFADHNSDLGANGHGYRREESVEIQPVAERFWADCRNGEYARADYEALYDEYAKMVEAADRLAMNEEDSLLVAEITPWLYQFSIVGKSGMAALEMAKALKEKDEALFMRKYRHLQALQKQSYLLNQTYNQNSGQPGMKTASLVMQPLADGLFALSVARFNQETGARLDSRVYTSPHKSYSSLPQCTNSAVRVRANQIYLSPVLEVVRWEAGKYAGMELERNVALQKIEADLGVEGVADWLRLEVSSDGNQWQEIPFTVSKTVLKADAQGVNAKYIRLLNKSNDSHEAYLRRFIITRQ